MLPSKAIEKAKKQPKLLSNQEYFFRVMSAENAKS